MACSAKGVFVNEGLHELGAISLPQGQAPLWIECQSGQFHRDIEKYLRLHKRLELERSPTLASAPPVCAARRRRA